jgi:hypothetical protein
MIGRVSEPAFDSARKAAAEETGQKVLLARRDSSFSHTQEKESFILLTRLLLSFIHLSACMRASEWILLCERQSHLHANKKNKPGDRWRNAKKLREGK